MHAVLLRDFATSITSVQLKIIWVLHDFGIVLLFSAILHIPAIAADGVILT